MNNASFVAKGITSIEEPEIPQVRDADESKDNVVGGSVIAVQDANEKFKSDSVQVTKCSSTPTVVSDTNSNAINTIRYTLLGKS